MDVKEVVLGKSIPEPNTGCWLWLGQLRDGYGRLHSDGKLLQAHRVSYEAFVCDIPDGLQIDHLCRVRCCVNPEHLEPVTQLENVRRGDAAGGRFAAAFQRAKTHCPKGHPYSEENTEHRKVGSRRCRACHRAERQRVRDRRKKGLI